MKIPDREAGTLNGIKVRVPRDFTGQRNAVLLVQRPMHFVVFASWHAALAEILRSNSPERNGIYALGLIGPTPQWHRRLTRWAMKLQHQDAFAQEHIALMFCDRLQWMREARIRADTEAILAVCDREGTVFEAAAGGPSSATVARIATAMTAVSGATRLHPGASGRVNRL